MATKKPIGTAEAVEMLGVLPQTVVRLIRDGEIPGFKVRDVWRVYREDVEASIQRQMEKARQVATDRTGDSTRSCSPVCAHPPVSSSIGYPQAYQRTLFAPLAPGICPLAKIARAVVAFLFPLNRWPCQQRNHRTIYSTIKRARRGSCLHSCPR